MTVSTAAKQRPLIVPARVRRWARENGYTVGQRGVLRTALIEAYRDARAERITYSH